MRRKTIGLKIMIYAFACCLSASGRAPLARAGGKDAAPKTYTYKTVGDLKIQADVYRLPGEEVRPVVVWIHGGALILGDRNGLRADQRERYLQAGYVVVSIDYRLAPAHPFPAALDDCMAAYGEVLRRREPSTVIVAGVPGFTLLTSACGTFTKTRTGSDCAKSKSFCTVRALPEATKEPTSIYRAVIVPANGARICSKAFMSWALVSDATALSRIAFWTCSVASTVSSSFCELTWSWNSC